MRLWKWPILLAVACVLVDPASAFAWGPASHVGLGTTVLENLALLPAAVAAVLARHRVAYLYGNIAADVVFAKRLSRIKQFCHHWSTGFRLLDSARDDKARAFAYGYLSHLAADTIAHNKYVPHQIVVSQCSVNFGHFFWELRAESTESDANRNRLDALLEHEHDHHHLTLESHLTGTFLPYELNRRLFDYFNTLASMRTVARGVGLWNHRPRWHLPTELLDGYRGESVDRIVSLLEAQRDSVLLREDPNGTSAMMQISVRQRELRRMKRRGLPVRHRIQEAARSLGPQTPLTESASLL